MKPLLLFLALGLPAAGPPLKPDKDGDYLPALQAAVDAGQALTDADGSASFTLELPPGSYPLSGPLYIDGRNVTLKGDGPRLSGLNYGGPPLAVGVCRLGRQGLDPARYRVPSPAGGDGLSTKGEVKLLATACPAQLGAGMSTAAVNPDYWGSAAYCWEFLVRLPSDPASSDALFGLWADTGAPGPWGFRAGHDPGSLQLWFRTAGQAETQYRRASFPVPSDRGWHRVVVQLDLDAGSASAWADGRAAAVTLDATDGSPLTPGARLARHDGATPFTVGLNSGGAKPCSDIDLGGLNVTKGLKYRAGAPAEARLDGRGVDDSRFQETSNGWGAGPDTVFSLALDGPAAATHWRLRGQAGDAVGFLLPAALPPAASRVRVEGLALSARVQQALAIGYCFGFTAVDCDAQGGAQGVGSVPIGCSYPVSLTRCRLGGYGAAYYGWEQIARLNDTEFSLSGRDGVLCQGGDFTFRDSLFTFSLGTESYFRTIGQGYGGALTVDTAQIDNEAGGPSVAVLDVDQSPYSVNRLTLRGVTASALGCPRFLRVNGRRGGDNTYPVGVLDVAGLSVYSGVPAGAAAVEVAGSPGSWVGSADLRSLGSGAVTGDAAGLKVTPPVVPAPAP